MLNLLRHAEILWEIEHPGFLSRRVGKRVTRSDLVCRSRLRLVRHQSASGLWFRFDLLPRVEGSLLKLHERTFEDSLMDIVRVQGCRLQPYWLHLTGDNRALTMLLATYFSIVLDASGLRSRCGSPTWDERSHFPWRITETHLRFRLTSNMWVSVVSSRARTIVMAWPSLDRPLLWY